MTPLQKNIPDLSIIVPMHNNENELAICLNSILLQPSPLHVECVLVNDGSTDASQTVAYSYAERFPQVRIISQSHAGAGAARNTGMAAAHGRYLWFVDADDYIAPDALQTIAASMRNTDIDVDCFLFSRVKRFFDADRIEALPDRLKKLYFDPKIEERIIDIEQHPAIASMIFWPLHILVFRRDFVNANALRCSETLVMNDMLMALGGICCARKLLTRNRVIYTYCRRDETKPDHTSLIADERRLACMAVLDACDRLLEEKRLSPEVMYNYHISKAALLGWTLDIISPALRPAIENYLRNFLASLPQEPLMRLYREVPGYYMKYIQTYFNAAMPPDSIEHL